MSGDINTELADLVRRSIQDGLTEESIKRAKKQVVDLCVDLETDMQYAMVERLSDYLGGYVEEMAKRTVDAILRGNEDLVRRYLSCDVHGYTGRSDWSSPYVAKRPPADWHPVIRGHLHEGSQIELRKAIVNAHRDLLVTERIKDLEDQMKALVEQINAKDAAIERLRERLP